MTTFIDRLHDDHEHMRDLLEVLTDLVGRMHQNDVDVDYHLMLDIFDYFRAFPDAVHHPVEDQLFDRLLERAPELGTEIGELRGEHTAHKASSHEIFEYLEGICAGHMVDRQELIDKTEAFITNQLGHMNKEEGRIFRAAHELVPEDEWHEFEQQHKDEIDPLFGPTIRDTFKRLHDYVVEANPS